MRPSTDAEMQVGLPKLVPANLADELESEARSIANLWGNGCAGLRQSIFVALLKVYIQHTSIGSETAEAVIESASAQAH